MRLKHLYDYLGGMKHYIFAACAVFAAGIWIGYVQAEQFQALIEEQLKGLEIIREGIVQAPTPELWFFIFIFLNNAIKSVLIVLTGAIFGIIPIFFLVMNGLLLGYIAAVKIPDHLLVTFIKGILPHGIIEIPAILLAGAFGIRFGFLLLKWIVSTVVSKNRREVDEQFKAFIRALPPFLFILVTALFVAALIESTITYWLVQ